jgi:3,4-dihydroxy 2-butanone 4-phosphate synthase/GTP cyclohydrolase II
MGAKTKQPVGVPQPIRGLDELRQCLALSAGFRAAHGRPFVVLSYAQSVDGCIAGRNRERIRLSGPESMRLTYGIRALCDTILVGIGTVLADDPQLTVKEVAGPDPRPIVLDTHLRTPPGARLLARRAPRVWLVHAPTALPSRIRALGEAGAEPMPCPTGPDDRIDLTALMKRLAEHSVNSVMVEGGARVITSFVGQRLADVLIVTISAKWVGGLQVVDQPARPLRFDLELPDPFFQPLGKDVILWARSRWVPP